MIEVLFGESEAESMKVAKNCNETEKCRGVTKTIGKSRKAFSEEMNHWILGNSSKVICLGFLLDIGDLKEAIDSKYR